MIRKVLLLLTVLALNAQAIDVDPSKNTVPEKFIEPGGKRFSIFSGDPKRIQRANSINFADLESKVEVTPAPFSLKAAADAPGGRPTLKISYSFHNKGKRTYTFSFPTSQRYDLTIKTSSGQAVYTWSADKEFVESIGTMLVNADDIIEYSETVPLADLSTPLTAGNYTVEAVLSNYPELIARTTLTVAP